MSYCVQYVRAVGLEVLEHLNLTVANTTDATMDATGQQARAPTMAATNSGIFPYPFLHDLTHRDLTGSHAGIPAHLFSSPLLSKWTCVKTSGEQGDGVAARYIHQSA